GQGSLYPALHRLQHQGWIKAEWKASDLGRDAKFYAITREGRKQLERELKTWERLSSAVQLLIERAPACALRFPRILGYRFRSLFRPADADTEPQRELDVHLDQLTK